jgi:2-dehydropantoate 2-reductase
MLKAPYLEAAVTGLLDHARVDAYVSFGNGLIQDRLEALVGAPRMLIGIVEWGATNLGPGQVAQTTVAPFVVGEIDGSRSERVERLRQVLSCAGDARISDNMFGQVWSKLLLNSTFSGLGAISGLVYADVVASPSGTELAFALWAEGHATARANGVMLDEVAGVHPDQLLITDSTADASAALAQLMSRLGPTKASMLQDLERGARTEVDVINGGVVQAAQRAGLAAPLNARIAEMVHECEAGSRTPDPANLDDLAGMLD